LLHTCHLSLRVGGHGRCTPCARGSVLVALLVIRLALPDVGEGPGMTTRLRLPDRRAHELLDFEHGGVRYTAGVDRFNDGGLAEIFPSTAKHGTAVDLNARDAAVAASLLLQHGCPVDTLRRALTRNSDGSASGPLARALDLLAEAVF